MKILILLTDADGVEERRYVTLGWLLNLVRNLVKNGGGFTIKAGGTIEVVGDG